MRDDKSKTALATNTAGKAHNGSLSICSSTWLYKAGGDGALYPDAHDEPQAYAAGQTYLPEAMTVAGIHFYQPNRRGFEIKLLINWNNCALDAAATVNKTGEKP